MIARVLRGGVVLLFLVVCAAAFYEKSHFIRLHVYTILSSSMKPAVLRGDVVITTTLSPQAYKVNDIITFFVPGRASEVVTHRIVNIMPAHGQVSEELFTKGDANSNGDSWVLSPGNIQGKVVWRVPFVGYVFYACQTMLGYSLIVLLTFFWLVVPLVKSWLWPGL